MTEWTHDQQIVARAEPELLRRKADDHQGDLPHLRGLRRPGLYVVREQRARLLPSRVDRISSGSCADPALIGRADHLPALELLFHGLRHHQRADRQGRVPPGALQVDRSQDAGRNDLQGRVRGRADVLPTNIPGNNPDAGHAAKASTRRSSCWPPPGSTPLRSNSNSPISKVSFYKTVAQYLQSAWQDNLGIKIKLTPIEDSAYSDWRAARETQPFNIYTGSWGSDFADASNWFNQNFTHCRRPLPQPLVKSRNSISSVATAVTNTNTEERNSAVRPG